MQSELIENFDEFLYQFNDSQSTRKVEMSFTIADFEEVEELKAFTLYPISKFDGNPQMYTLLVKYPLDGWVIFAKDYECITEVDDEVTHFMYLDEDIKK